MFRRKKKAAMLAAQEEATRAALAKMPPLPTPERAFFDMLLHALSGGLHELAHAAKQPQKETCCADVGRREEPLLTHRHSCGWKNSMNCRTVQKSYRLCSTQR